jgi:hypothetical protein
MLRLRRKRKTAETLAKVLAELGSARAVTPRPQRVSLSGAR